MTEPIGQEAAMRYHHHGGDGWGYGLTLLGMLLILALLITLGIVLYRHLAHTPQHHPVPPPVPPPPGRADPEDLLAERLARGEIDPDDYRQRLDALRAGRGVGPGPGAGPGPGPGPGTG